MPVPDPFPLQPPELHRRRFHVRNPRHRAAPSSDAPGLVETRLLRTRSWLHSQSARARAYVRHEPDTETTALGVVWDAARAAGALLALLAMGGITAMTIALPWIVLAGFISLEVGFWFFVVAFAAIALVCGGLLLEHASLGVVALYAWLSALPVALGLGIIRGYV